MVIWVSTWMLHNVIWLQIGHYTNTSATTCGDTGLHLNASKCELIAHPNFSTTDALLQSFTRVDVCEASLLGAPRFHDSGLDKSWNGCCDDLARAAERLRDIGCQDALIYSSS